MQRRILVCFAGGLLGMWVASPLGASLEIAPTTALVGFAAVGLGFGYLVSVIVDVFCGNLGSGSPPVGG